MAPVVFRNTLGPAQVFGHMGLIRMRQDYLTLQREYLVKQRAGGLFF